MDKSCTVCKGEGKYKCPTCSIYYCSVRCCKDHRRQGCDVWVKGENSATPLPPAHCRYTSADTVPLETLELLRNDGTLRNILCNPHLRNVLVEVNNSKEPEKIMHMVMQEPLFVEFADACLKVVEPHDDDQ